MSLLIYVVFLFFKQKTAYEMRISDWSSDVCSSDLRKPIRLTKDQASGPVTELLSLYRRWRVAQAFPFGISAIRGARPAMLRPRTVARIAETTALTASDSTSSSITRSAELSLTLDTSIHSSSRIAYPSMHTAS